MHIVYAPIVPPNVNDFQTQTVCLIFFYEAKEESRMAGDSSTISSTFIVAAIHARISLVLIG